MRKCSLWAAAMLAALFIPQSASAVVYTLDVSAVAPRGANFFVFFGAPSIAGQTITVTGDLSNPSGDPVFIGERVEAGEPGIFHVRDVGAIDTFAVCPASLGSACTDFPSPEVQSLVLDNGATVLQVSAAFLAGAPDATFSLHVDIPDALLPGPMISTPEPATWAMMMIGFLILGVAGRRGFSAA